MHMPRAVLGNRQISKMSVSELRKAQKGIHVPSTAEASVTTDRLTSAEEINRSVLKFPSKTIICLEPVAVNFVVVERFRYVVVEVTPCDSDSVVVHRTVVSFADLRNVGAWPFFGASPTQAASIEQRVIKIRN